MHSTRYLVLPRSVDVEWRSNQGEARLSGLASRSLSGTFSLGTVACSSVSYLRKAMYKEIVKGHQCNETTGFEDHSSLSTVLKYFEPMRNDEGWSVEGDTANSASENAPISQLRNLSRKLQYGSFRWP